MLPFLKARKSPGIVMATVSPGGKTETLGMEGDMDPGLMAAAEDILRAIAAKDATHLAHAIKAAFEMCDEAPHEEGPHTPEGA